MNKNAKKLIQGKKLNLFLDGGVSRASPCAFEQPLGIFSVMWPPLSSTVMLYLSLSLCTVMEI